MIGAAPTFRCRSDAPVRLRTAMRSSIQKRVAAARSSGPICSRRSSLMASRCATYLLRSRSSALQARPCLEIRPRPPYARAVRLGKEGFGVTACAWVAGVRTEHAAELLDDQPVVQLGHGRPGQLALALLLDPEVAIGDRRGLGKVRDREDLPVPAEPAQALADDARRVPTDARVHFVEDQRRRAAVSGNAHQLEQDERGPAAGS